MLSESEIAAIEERARTTDAHRGMQPGVIDRGGGHSPGCMDCNANEAALADVPALVAEVRRLKEDNERIQREHADIAQELLARERKTLASLSEAVRLIDRCDRAIFGNGHGINEILRDDLSRILKAWALR